MSNIFISFRDLPSTSVAAGGDKFVVETADGYRVIDYSNIIFPTNNTTFAVTVSANTTNIDTLSSEHDIRLQSVTDTAKVLPTVTKYFILTAGIPGPTINGPGVGLPLNFVQSDNLTVTLSSEDDAACGLNTTTLATSSVVLPYGTYRVKGAVSLVAKDINSGDEFTYALMDFVQVTPPFRRLITSNIHTIGSPTIAEQVSVSLYIEGYFYLCKNAEVALRASTRGSFYVGDGYDVYGMGDPILGQRSVPVQLLIEKINDDDVYNIGSVSL